MSDDHDEPCVLPPQVTTKDWFIEYLHDHKGWSLKTFGYGFRTVGLTSHIIKETTEIRKAPHDLEEWIDVVILALDGALRCHNGVTPSEVIRMLEYKQQKNFARTYPPATEDTPCEHVREGDA